MNRDGLELRYRLAFPEPWTHRVDVALEIPASPAGKPVELWMPVWTPGSYLVREYARHVEGFSARDDKGGNLAWRKTAKNRWEIEGRHGTAIEVRYRIYGRELSVRTNWIEGEFALLNGAATFLTVRGLETHPHHLELELPRSWAGAWSGLDPADPPPPVPEAGDPKDGIGSRSSRGGLHRFRARDHDHLVDSPILAGNPGVHPFTVDDVPVTLLNLGEGGLWDGERAAGDVRTLVNEVKRIYGSLPVDRYLFFNLIVEGRGGLEHGNSCVMMTSRYAYRNRKAYVDWLGLVSHEFFHVWNGKRSRPRGLGPFDYEREAYTRGLWVAEGITAYYTHLVPSRSGLISEAEYLEALSLNIDRLQSTPGRRAQSLEESSFDAWIKLYRADENTQNSTISYYVKGAVVAWLLDVEIRKATGGERSLDHLMRLLFDRHSGDRGYSDEEVQSAAEEIAGRPLAGLFDACVRGTEELDYQPALDHLGLRFRPVKEAERPPVWLGIETGTDSGRLMIRKVRSDGPSWEAGLNVDDEILALGGYRVNPDTIAERLNQYAPGDRLDVLLARREAVRLVPVTLTARPEVSWSLEADPGASGDRVEARRQWLRGGGIP